MEHEIYCDPAEKVGSLQLYNDNNTACQNIRPGTFRPPNQHVGVHYNWLRDMHDCGDVQIHEISTNDMTADALTKAVACEKLCNSSRKLG